MKTFNISLVALIVAMFSTEVMGQWSPSTTSTTLQMERNGNTWIGSSLWSNPLFQSAASHSNWSGYFYNGHGQAQALRVKGGWYNSGVAPVFQVEGNSSNGSSHDINNIRFTVMANGNTGLGLPDPRWRFHLKGTAYSDEFAATSNDFIQMIEGEPQYASLRVWHTSDINSNHSYENNSTAISAERMDVSMARGVDTWGRFAGVVSYGYQFTGETNYGCGVWADGKADYNSFGIHARASGGTEGTADCIGVYGNAQNWPYSNNSSIGVKGEAQDGTLLNYGVMGIASVNGGGNGIVNANYAGFFNGDVYYSGTVYNSSDRKLKKNIRELNDASSLLEKLKLYSYEFKTEEFSEIHLPHGTQYGLIAQELQKEFPQWIKTSIIPAQKNEDGEEIKPATEFLAVNYQSLLPILVKAHQEQEEEIKTLEEELLIMKEEIASIKDQLIDKTLNTNINRKVELEEIKLIPNPANTSTTIHYSSDGENHLANVLVYSLDGRLVKELNMNNNAGSLTIETADISPGTYIVSLSLDGNLIDTKHLVISN